MSDFSHALRWQYDDGDTQIWVYAIDAVYAIALTQFAPDVIAKISQAYKSPRRQREKIALHALIAVILPTKCTLKYAPNGRPYLTQSSRHISISHHETSIAIALSHAPIGIDIEPDSPQIVRVAPKFVSAEELLWAENEHFPLTALWCAKEALYKWANTPGLSPLKEIRLNPLPTPNTLQANVAGFNTTPQIHIERLDEADYLAWCAHPY